MAAKGWSLLDGTGNIYAYRTTVTAGADIKVFESFKIADNADVAAYEGAKINVTAYAVQADGFETAAAAWAAAGPDDSSSDNSSTASNVSQ